MSIGEFLRNKIGLKVELRDLQALDSFSGETVGNTTFYKGLDECVANIEDWMPIYFFPVAVESGFHIGIHLRPLDVSAGRLAFMMAVDESQLIEVAVSLQHYIFRSLARQEGYVNETGPLSYFEQSVSVVKRILGTDFYKPGRYGKFSEDDANEVVSKVFGKAPSDYHEAAMFEDDIHKKLAILEEGIKAEPGCMKLYINATELYNELDNENLAAQTLIKSLKCFHHTCYSSDLDDYYDTGRSLLEAVPDIFPDEARRDLTTTDEESRFKLITTLYQNEQVAEATKMLCDMCHSFGDYNSVLNILRKHYSKLKWDWALALCDLRS